MGNINHFGPNTTKEVLVDRMIGDSFTIVKELWEQIPTIIELMELHIELSTRIREAIANIEAETTGSLDVINNARLTALLEIQNKHEAAIRDIGNRHNAAVEEIEELLALSLREIIEATSLAKDWANKPMGQIVEGSEYSAKHYAQIAATIVSSMSSVNWHPKIVGVDLVIPDNYNAWSAGPVVTIPEGVKMTIGEDSYWTII